ncbi:hypothetical protein A1O7_06822 [Cladophialophora yegresii CBS 114405]|uniref:Uncharacterized protein n=1 Tax=Cladophialophora yegresii CBS 114405 TaxID=1182544 RepID=W9VLU4_9EURO|nr:uncharacterized protein A1O7_06822 [Cladophialophora yegresii CBS 114405]EXJ56478.1 hypothetical protein A1O7_06822 [Cladophialophora yegresii CBS 114405]
MDNPAPIEDFYSQYKTSNMQAIYKDLYPSPGSDPAEEDALVQKRMEVAKSAPGLEQQKKSFTAVNERAAQEREEAGVKARDFAIVLPVGCCARCQKHG